MKGGVKSVFRYSDKYLVVEYDIYYEIVIQIHSDTQCFWVMKFDVYKN